MCPQTTNTYQQIKEMVKECNSCIRTANTSPTALLHYWIWSAKALAAYIIYQLCRISFKERIMLCWVTLTQSDLRPAGWEPHQQKRPSICWGSCLHLTGCLRGMSLSVTMGPSSLRPRLLPSCIWMEYKLQHACSALQQPDPNGASWLHGRKLGSGLWRLLTHSCPRNTICPTSGWCTRLLCAQLLAQVRLSSSSSCSCVLTLPWPSEVPRSGC